MQLIEMGSRADEAGDPRALVVAGDSGPRLACSIECELASASASP